MTPNRIGSRNANCRIRLHDRPFQNAISHFVKHKGRDHNPFGFTMWLAGDGVKPGYTHGATDELGIYAVEGRAHVHDLHATILHLLGFDHEQFTFPLNGRDERLTITEGKVITEILA